MIHFFIIIIVLNSSLLSAMDYPCCKLVSPPIIDGKLDDVAWKNIPTATGFKDYGSGGFALRQSWFKAAYNDDALFIAVNIKEENFETALCSLPRASRIMELDNCIHIKIKTPQGESVFTVNAANSRHSRIISRSELWNNFSSEIVRGKDNWQLEIKIPFGKNLPKPQVGKSYGFFLAQYSRDDSRYALYAPWGDELAFLWKDNAYTNTISFLGINASGNFCKRIEQELNGSFLNYLKWQRKQLDENIRLNSMWVTDPGWRVLTQNVAESKTSSFAADKLLDSYYKLRNSVRQIDDSTYREMLINLTK